LADEFDALDRIATSYATLAATQALLARTQQLLARLQGFAIVLLGGCLLFTGYVVWQHLAQNREHAALNAAVLTNTQTIAAQTQAILTQMSRTPAP
jgi:hypothetical protein